MREVSIGEGLNFAGHTLDYLVTFSSRAGRKTRKEVPLL